MASDAYQSRFEEGWRLYEEAQTPEDYQGPLDIFLELLRTDDLTENIRHDSMLFSAKCMIVLGCFEDAESQLRKLLGEIGPAFTESKTGLVVAATLSLAEILSKTSSWREAIDLFLKTIVPFHETGDWYSEASVHHQVAGLWFKHSELENAKASLDTAWSVLESHEPTPLHLQVLFARGHYSYLSDDIESAIEFEERALKVAQRLGETETESHLLGNLAHFTIEAQDFQRAIRYNVRILQQARGDGNPEQIIRLLAVLGSCYTETARPAQAIVMFNEAMALLSAQNRADTIQFGFCLFGKGQALVDLKQYDEARTVLPKAKTLFDQFGEDTKLLVRVEDRLTRESRGPMTVDCAHRLLQMTLSGSSRNTSHSNPQPTFDLTKFQYLTTDLSPEERERFAKLHEELNRDLYRTKYQDSSNQDVPGTFIMPLKLEYTDDVEAFEIKWNAYKRELMYSERCATLQADWERDKKNFSFVEGPFAGDKIDLIFYITHLSRIAELCAELGNRELLKTVSLHAADFLELETEDPMVLALVWPVRARLIMAAHVVAPSYCRELLEVELRHCLDQIQKIFLVLSRGHRESALPFIVELWFHAASKILGRVGYAGLVSLVDDLVDSLEPVDRIYYALALGEAVDPAQGVQLIDSIIAKTRSENPNVRLTLAPEFEIALAVQRFKTLAHDPDSCVRQYGPFATYIHSEILEWTDDVWPVTDSEKNAPHTPALAFTDGNLVVIDNRLIDLAYAETIFHELSHQFRRVGQQVCTEDGRWVLMRRDVPVASAMTYLLLIKSGSLERLAPQAQGLIDQGRRLAESQPELSALHIKNVLRYFDDLGTHETRASYSCAAILLGMAFGYLHDAASVSSYIQHLEVLDHDEALVYGLKKASLQL